MKELLLLLSFKFQTLCPIRDITAEICILHHLHILYVHQCKYKWTAVV